MILAARAITCVVGIMIFAAGTMMCVAGIMVFAAGAVMFAAVVLLRGNPSKDPLWEAASRAAFSDISLTARRNISQRIILRA